MMIRKSLEWFGGSVVVYVLVAACAGSGVLDESDEQVAGGGNEPTGEPIDTDGDGEPDGMDTDGDGVIDQPMPVGDGDGDGDMSSIMDPVPEAEAAEDGTRIVNRYRTTPGGLRTATGGFYDTERDEACQFAGTASGDRCMPAVPFETATMGYYDTAGYHSDASCTVPLAYAAYACDSPRYAAGYRVTNANNCTTAVVVEYYEVGARYTASVFYAKSAGACVEFQTATWPYELYTVGARIPDTDFAEGSLQNGG